MLTKYLSKLNKLVSPKGFRFRQVLLYIQFPTCNTSNIGMLYCNVKFALVNLMSFSEETSMIKDTTFIWPDISLCSQVVKHQVMAKAGVTLWVR
jgi:hypothetical protein